MKKKLLSLVLAGAMVASTSVSAFADTISAANGQINGSDDREYTTDITIEGNVANDSGDVNPGTLKVTVATAAAFSVDEHGNLQGSNIKISNSGTQDIDVYAHRFTDITPNDKITVVGESNLSDVDRRKVSLNVHGNKGTAYLGSELGNKKSGIYSEKTLQSSNGVEELKIATVVQNGSQELVLSGDAGKKTEDVTIDEAVSDRFTLVLKIKKAEAN